MVVRGRDVVMTERRYFGLSQRTDPSIRRPAPIPKGRGRTPKSYDDPRRFLGLEAARWQRAFEFVTHEAQDDHSTLYVLSRLSRCRRTFPRGGVRLPDRRTIHPKGKRAERVLSHRRNMHFRIRRQVKREDDSTAHRLFEKPPSEPHTAVSQASEGAVANLTGGN